MLERLHPGGAAGPQHRTGDVLALESQAGADRELHSGLAPARDDDLGHFHLTGPEFWFQLEGQNEFKIGSVPIFVANQGDIVYAPAQTWHRPRHVGTGMATRLAIVGYANSHVYGLTSGAE